MMPSIGAALIETLLHEEESPSLDFKREQYRFVGAGDHEKSELLKDILAFANSWRRSDAYILVGVEEVKGGKSTVIGVTDDIDDAQLQEFVNKKTQKPIDFSYQAVRFDGERIGVIHIPIQERPFYLKKNFVNLHKEKVYIRRGSSTDIALPDEVARMGRESSYLILPDPQLSAGLGYGREREMLGCEISLDLLNLEVPDAANIPDYEHNFSSWQVPGIDKVKPDYYRNLVSYVKTMEAVADFDVYVQNLGDAVARDVRLVLSLGSSAGDLRLMDEVDLPKYPERTWSSLHLGMQVQVPDPSPLDVVAEREAAGRRAEAYLGKVQPKDTVWTSDSLYLRARESGIYTVNARIFSDDLREPEDFEIVFEITVRSEEADLDRIEAINSENLRKQFESEHRDDR